jgi:hypothetical protein
MQNILTSVINFSEDNAITFNHFINSSSTTVRNNLVNSSDTIVRNNLVNSSGANGTNSINYSGTTDTITQCYICFEENNLISMCDCRLSVHKKCIEQWISTSNNHVCRICSVVYEQRETEIEIRGKITGIYNGSQFTIMKVQNGEFTELYVTGSNERGQLCTEKDNIMTWTQTYMITDLDAPIKKIKCGTRHVIILLEDNTLVSVGDNQLGQLGWNMSDKKIIYPMFEKFKETITKIKCSNKQTLLLTNQNKIWMTGQGWLGHTDQSLNRDFFLVDFSPNEWIQKIALGHNHLIVLTDSGKIWVKGNNHYGQLGLEESALIISEWTELIVPMGKPINIKAHEDLTCVVSAEYRFQQPTLFHVYACGSIGISLPISPFGSINTLTHIGTFEDRSIKVILGSKAIVVVSNNKLNLFGSETRFGLSIGWECVMNDLWRVISTEWMGTIVGVNVYPDAIMIRTIDKSNNKYLFGCGKCLDGKFGLASTKNFKSDQFNKLLCLNPI